MTFRKIRLDALYNLPGKEARSAWMHKEIVMATYEDGLLVNVKVIGKWHESSYNIDARKSR